MMWPPSVLRRSAIYGRYLALALAVEGMLMARSADIKHSPWTPDRRGGLDWVAGEVRDDTLGLTFKVAEMILRPSSSESATLTVCRAAVLHTNAPRQRTLMNSLCRRAIMHLTNRR